MAGTTTIDTSVKFSNIFLLLVLFSVGCTAYNRTSCCGNEKEVLSLIEVNNDTVHACVDTAQHTNHSLLFGDSNCKDGTSFVNLPLSEDLVPQVSTDGTLTLSTVEDLTVFSNDSYCFVDILSDGVPVPYIFLCIHPEEEDVKVHIFAILMLISVLFYILTAFIYIWISELRDLFGKAIINFCLAMGIGLFILAIMNLVRATEWEFENYHCAARGFFAYLFLVAGFFGSNVISIITLQSVRKPCAPDPGWKPFIWYALYAWGVPVVLTVAMAIVNFHPGDHAKPGIGLSTCWFIDSHQRWYWLYSVMTVLIGVNIIIFCYVAYCLWHTSRFQSGLTREIKYKSKLTLKLFILLGIPWFFEMISSSSPDSTFMIIIDFLNMCQGFFIFLILVLLRKRTLKAMNKRGWLRCLPHNWLNRHLGSDEEAEIIPQNTIDCDNLNGSTFDRK